MEFIDNIEHAIGNTPLVMLGALSADCDAQIFAKLEFMNPAGSIKDRAALQMIKNAEEEGILDSNTVIIEPTSGNTGIALAAIASVRGYKTTIVMPDNMSAERIDTMKAYGAEVVLTPAKTGMKGSIDKAHELASCAKDEGKKAFIPDQFCNPANALAHYKTTGPEIYDALDGNVDAFVAGIGTGGTITGVAKYLKEQNPDIKIFGVEPASSPIISTLKDKGFLGADSSLKTSDSDYAQVLNNAAKNADAHKIQGIGANFVPELLDLTLLDNIITVSDAEAYERTRKLASKEGIFSGISSGANVCGAWKAAEILAQVGINSPNIVTVLPDGGAKYMSTGVFGDGKVDDFSADSDDTNQDSDDGSKKPFKNGDMFRKIFGSYIGDKDE